MKCTKLVTISALILTGLYSCMFGINQKSFDEIFPALVKEVLTDQTRINDGKKKPFSAMYYWLKWNEGYGPKEYAFLELSFPFFELSPNKIEAILKSANLDRVTAMIEQCKDNPEDRQLRGRAAYGSLLNATNLPENIDKNTLVDDPEKFKPLLEGKKIDQDKHNILIAEGLILRYCCKHHCQ